MRPTFAADLKGPFTTSMRSFSLERSLAPVAVLLAMLLPVSLFAAGDEETPYSEQVMHHISDANEFHVLGDLHIPLPIIAWSKEDGLFTGWSSDFYAHDGDADEGHDHAPHGGEVAGDHPAHEGHEDHAPHAEHAAAAGHHANRVINGYFLDHGVLRRLSDATGRASVHHIDGTELRESADGERLFALVNGQAYAVDNAATLLDRDSFIDFSITKNVATMLMAAVLFAIIFIAVARGYARNRGKAPSGIQSFFEPIILFVRDDIAKEMIGPKYEKYFPYLATLFFFILFVNLFGLIPIAPFGSNVTGNIGLTLTLAVVTFVVVNLSGNRHYWGHIFWMPGVPWPLKPVMAVIEFLGIFIKPFTLMIRLFANITAGHIIILSLIGLIFLFGDNGASMGGSLAGAALAVPFVFVMNLLELFVAFLQAFIFTLLSALYIGAAVEEHHHTEHEHEQDGSPAAHIPA